MQVLILKISIWFKTINHLTIIKYQRPNVGFGGIMKRYKKILVPVDGSKLSDMAFEQAISLAKMVGGVVQVIHVMEPLHYDLIPFEITDVHNAMHDIEKESKSRIESILSEFVKKGKEVGVVVNSELVRGNIADKIITASSQYDLIIMGSLGQGALANLLLGSVAEKVSRHACCPVMLVREIGRECKV